MSLLASNALSLSLVLQGWARSAKTMPEAARKAEELMQLQMQLVDSNVLPENAKADMQTFAIVMMAYSKSSDPDKAHHTYRLLHELIQNISEGKIVPGSDLVHAFTAVLDAAAYASPSQTSDTEIDNEGPFVASTSTSASSNSDEYAIALQAYRELKDDIFQVGCKADHFVFARMLDVIGTHTDPTSSERRQMLELVFDDARAAGQVSRLVLKYLFKVCPDKALLSAILQNEDLASGAVESVDVLPRPWTRNVPHKFRSMKRVPSQHRKFGNETT